jgi:hypothetical protein
VKAARLDLCNRPDFPRDCGLPFVVGAPAHRYAASFDRACVVGASGHLRESGWHPHRPVRARSGRGNQQGS